MTDFLRHKLALGTVQFGTAYGISNTGGQVSPQVAADILRHAAQAQIDTLDTAANYGMAESVLGNLDLTPFSVVTKTANLTSVAAVIDRVRQSVVTLGGVDIVMVHAAKDLLGPDGDALWNGLRQLKDDGVVGGIGISTYVSDEPAKLAARFRPDAMQVPFSLLDQRLLHDGTLERLAETKIEVHARSLFLQGLLFLEALPDRLKPAQPHLDRLRVTLAAQGVSPLAAALAFVLQRPEIARGVVGVTSVAELEEILQATAHTLPALNWHDFALDDELVLTPSLW